MAFQISPGVNVSEIDLTTVVPAVATTTGAFAGVFRWGPTNEPILVDSEVKLVERFAKPHANTTWQNAESFFTAANFLSYSNSLFVVRVDNGGAISAANTALFTDFAFEAKYQGELGNSLEVLTIDGSTATLAGETYKPNFSATGAINEFFIDISVDRTKASFDGTTSINLNGDTIQAGDVLELADGTRLQIASVSGTDINFTSRYTGFEDVGDGTSSVNVTRYWKGVNAISSAPSSANNIHVVVVDAGGEITGVAGTVLETFQDLSTNPSAKAYDGSSNYYQTVIADRSAYIGVADSHQLSGDRDYARLVGGTDGATELSPSISAFVAGYDKFKNADEIDISLILTGRSESTLASYIIDNIAETRKDAVVFVSPGLSDDTSAEIVSFRNSLPSSSYAVMDSGYKYQYDKYNDVYRWVPLNGDVAGLCARTDEERDPWFSPAGYNRGNVKNVIKLNFNPGKADRDRLYAAGVNPVITQPGQGTVLFGDKTLLAQPSAFDRINVRRLFIVLEKAVARASKSTLFEFNDEFTRAQFRNLVEPFLRDVQGRRGIYDFKVVCDDTNNTAEVIDGNRFVGDIYIKPARSINFIQLNFVAVRTGVEFEEIVGQF